MTLKSVIMCGMSILIELVLFGQANIASAAEPFAKIKLTPASKIYFVAKDVNVRAAPKTKSTRVGRLRKGVRITAVGEAKGSEWVAVQKDGKDFGFVYGTALVPMIDGRLLNPVSGNLEARSIGERKLPPCHYKIKFDGKVKVEGDLQITSDYILNMECDHKKKTLKINASMFVTEMPYLGDRKPIYQINVDLFNISIGDDDIFSATVLYHVLKNEITFDGVSKPAFKAKGKIAKKNAPDLTAALKGAVAMAHQSWGAKVWAMLAKAEEP
jgi:hypothetical protein